MNATLQKKATPFLGAGLLIQVGGTFLRFIDMGLMYACIAIGAAVLVIGCMFYAQAKGFRRELGLLGLLSLVGVIALIFMRDKEAQAPAQATGELPSQTTEAFKDDPSVQDAIASISALEFASGNSRGDSAGQNDTDDLDTGPDELDLKQPAKPAPKVATTANPAARSSEAARKTLVGDAQGEIVPSRLIKQVGGKLTFTCHCGKRYKVDQSKAGEMMACRYCKKHLLVPVPELKS